MVVILACSLSRAQAQQNVVRMCGALVSADCLRSQNADGCVSQLMTTIEAERQGYQGSQQDAQRQALAIALPVCAGEVVFPVLTGPVLLLRNIGDNV